MVRWPRIRADDDQHNEEDGDDDHDRDHDDAEGGGDDKCRGVKQDQDTPPLSFSARSLGLLSASVLSPHGVQVIPNLLICLVEASKLGLVAMFRVGSCQVKVEIGAQT